MQVERHFISVCGFTVTLDISVLIMSIAKRNYNWKEAKSIEEQIKMSKDRFP